HRLQHALLDVQRRPAAHRGADAHRALQACLEGRAAVRSDHRRPAHLHPPVEGGVDAEVGARRHPGTVLRNRPTVNREEPMLRTFPTRVMHWLPAALLMLAGAASTQAHHSFAAQYDNTRPVNMTGALTKLEWTNPHVYIYIDVTDGATSKV